MRSALTVEEQALLDLPREEAAAHRGVIGWSLENLWPLAWALGFEPEPTVDGPMIGEPIIRALFFEFLPGLDATVADLLAKAKPRSLEEVARREDLFYCAHDAVRSAQLGEDTVPEGFDPRADGGVVHERRHALTWMLSAGVGWDDTDLGT
ncbi:MAG: DUF4272 domain-containing protein [Sandaracinaceae bacterium]|nr:DUF4272 domain-containing protein [Sandaracinaceae bacterium]